MEARVSFSPITADRSTAAEAPATAKLRSFWSNRRRDGRDQDTAGVVDADREGDCPPARPTQHC